MLLSPVNLEHYILDRVDIEPVEGYVSDESQLYPDFSGAKFKAEINVSEVSGEHVPNPPAYQIHMALLCDPKEKNSFPYRFQISVTGFMSFRGEQTGKERTDIITVNGCALLYSTLRDALHSLTARFRNGPVLLPTVTFLDMRENTEKKAGSQIKEKPKTPRQRKKPSSDT